MDLADRLNWCCRQGNLTVADLARWFDRPDPTLRGWVSGTSASVGLAPGDAQEVETLLEALERLIKTKRGFPVPRLTRMGRVEHLRRIRNTINGAARD